MMRRYFATPIGWGLALAALSLICFACSRPTHLGQAYDRYLMEASNTERLMVEKGKSLKRAFEDVKREWQALEPATDSPAAASHRRMGLLLKQLDWLNHLLFYCGDCSAEQAEGRPTAAQLEALYEQIDKQILTDFLKGLPDGCEADDLAFGAYPVEGLTPTTAQCLVTFHAASAEGMRFVLVASAKLLQ